MKIDQVAIDDLNPAPYNPRVLTKKQYSDIKDSIEKFGLVDPIIVNKRNKQVIGGHQRLKICKEFGQKYIAVHYVDLDKEDERELNIRLNKNQGQWDFDILSNEFEVEDLRSYGFSAQDLGLENFNMLIDEDKEEEDSDSKKKVFTVMVMFESKKEMKQGTRNLMDLGYKCR